LVGSIVVLKANAVSLQPNLGALSHKWFNGFELGIAADQSLGGGDHAIGIICLTVLIEQTHRGLLQHRVPIRAALARTNIFEVGGQFAPRTLIGERTQILHRVSGVRRAAYLIATSQQQRHGI
jgi:hypothetical protein